MVALPCPVSVGGMECAVCVPFSLCCIIECTGGCFEANCFSLFIIRCVGMLLCRCDLSMLHDLITASC